MDTRFRKGLCPVASPGVLGHNHPRVTVTMWFGKPRNPEEHRYYLLPGQGRSNRRKRRQQLVAALITGAVFAAGLATLMWMMNERR